MLLVVVMMVGLVVVMLVVRLREVVMVLVISVLHSDRVCPPGYNRPQMLLLVMLCRIV